jgi:hypothetical protein
MASDYAALKEENIRRYGTDIGRIGPMLLANRYDDRSHFLFELLQNAEDALKRRHPQEGPRSVKFSLYKHELGFSHYGQLFTEPDVKGICGIGESTKSEDLTAIGRFGIGFKAVYAFTDSPEIYSGDEHFAIDSFVWPRALHSTGTREAATVFRFPFREDDETAHQEIAAGLQELGVRTLLFLREIDEISWEIDDGPSGTYLRDKPEWLSENSRRVTLVGQESSSLQAREETWLIFSKEVTRDNGDFAGHVEIAFALANNKIEPIPDSTLVVYFPTIVHTNLGFLIQGPYRTTPSRDNVPRNDRWNRHLVQESSSLLVDALHQLKNLDLLTVEALSALPLDSSKFAEGSMFEPLFEDVRSALTYEQLLPQFQGGHISAQNAELARTQELRELFGPIQLGALFGPPEELHWLSEEITQDRTPELRQYLMRELEISEIVPEAILPKLTKAFLEAQNDDWVLHLYEFLHGQPALQRQRRLESIPLVRLADGSHVVPKKDDLPQAFLPGPVITSFPTVRPAVCRTENARALLADLGLTEPDPVDDVVWNVLPKYVGEELDVDDRDYEADIGRILAAFGTDSKSQREKLLTALREANFVMTVDAGDGSKWVSKPGDAYLATQRLKDLFGGIADVLLVDDSYRCLRGEDVRDLLEACGATRYLQPVPVEPQFDWAERTEMRRKAGCESTTGGEVIEDYTLRGLEELLHILPALDPEAAARKGSLLWDALIDVENRRGAGTFAGSYRWFYYYQRNCEFDTSFLRTLNEVHWIPDGKGVLQPPSYVVFSDTGWNEHPFLQSKIHFKPPIIEALAKEAGIEPGLLDLLKKLGLTSEAELRARLGISDDAKNDQDEDSGSESLTPEEAIRALLGDVSEPTPPIEEEEPPSLVRPGSGGHGSETSGSGHGGGHRGNGQSKRGGGSSSPAGRPPGQKQGKTQTGHHAFISYVASHPDDEDPDPDGLAHEERLALEEKAIQIILASEPELKRTQTNNPGFDLLEVDDNNKPQRWVEVKAMLGTLKDRPVGLSKTQFECAQEHEEAYWLYVVERAASPDQSPIVRIQNPAGKARTFTFDHGWIAVAKIEE